MSQQIRYKRRVRYYHDGDGILRRRIPCLVCENGAYERMETTSSVDRMFKCTHCGSMSPLDEETMKTRFEDFRFKLKEENDE